MRKIKFDEKTINEIRDFIQEGHTKKETCNRFTLKLDTLSRIMKEHDIEPYHTEKITHGELKPLSEETVFLITNLYNTTLMSLQDIAGETGISPKKVRDVIEAQFSTELRSKRSARVYSKSKIGSSNPMFDKKGELHPNYKGVVSDGRGYLMVLKPDWYTGRKGSNHVFLHNIVICEHLGLTEIPEGFCVHHIDGNKINNDISNLCLLTIGAHSKLHQLQNKMCKVQRLSDNGVGDKPKR